MRILPPFFGKIVGVICGFLIAGFWGAFFGYMIGQYFDSAFGHLGLENASEEVRKHFFQATFLIMGYVAKSDGHVSTQEIHTARLFMDRMQLSADQKIQSMQLFNQGKRGDFDLNIVLQELRRELHNPYMLRMFIDIQLQAVLEGGINRAKKDILSNICRQLGLSTHLVEELEHLFNASEQFSRAHHQQYRQHSYSQGSSAQTLASAYEVLGVPQTATQEQVKRAYKKQMSENHPDKLVAQGLPESMIKLANEKTQKIASAYETICKAKGY